MRHPATVLYENEFKQINELCARLLVETRGKAVLLVDKNGQFIASHGDIAGLDTTSLASLTAGNIAATGGLAQMIGEKEFPHIHHEGERESLHLSVIGHYAILVVIFDERTSLGLVRLRVRKNCEDFLNIFQAVNTKTAQEGREEIFSQITDDDIDNLFGA